MNHPTEDEHALHGYAMLHTNINEDSIALHSSVRMTTLQGCYYG